MRLDEFLHRKGYFTSRTKAKQSVENGNVSVNGKVLTKPAAEIDAESVADVKITAPSDYVSLGGYKLEKALRDFGFSVKDFIAADLGASTGGFTDCLLQNGAKRVYAVDLNDDLLDDRLKKDGRVISVIKNARSLQKCDFGEPLDLVTADLSFISLTKVITIMSGIIDENKFVLTLIKPQFESDVKKRVKNGIVKDEKDRIAACRKVYDFAVGIGLSPLRLTTAPEKKGKNVEYLILFVKAVGKAVKFEELVDKIFNL